MNTTNPTTMNTEQQPEPLAAILAEMRDGIHTGRADIIDCVNDVLARYADRIEAAVKREKCRDTIYAGRDGEMTLDECIVRCDNNSGDDPRGRDIAQIGAWLRELRDIRRAPGNAAAMREALDKAECVLLVAARFATDNAFTDAEARENLRDVDWDGALAKIDAAIAERDRLRDIVRRMAKIIGESPIDWYGANFVEKQVLLAEARAALGEGETPTGKGVGR